MPRSQHFAIRVWETLGQLPNFKVFFSLATRRFDVQQPTRKTDRKSRTGDDTGWRKVAIDWLPKSIISAAEWLTGLRMLSGTLLESLLCSL